MCRICLVVLLGAVLVLSSQGTADRRSVYDRKGRRPRNGKRDDWNDAEAALRFQGSRVETEERGLFSSSKKPKPLECCQICPKKFYLDLLELSESVDFSGNAEEVYGAFHAWHSEIHKKSSLAASSATTTTKVSHDEDKADNAALGTFFSFAELEEESSKSGKGGVQPPPPSIEVLGQGPCCELCPELFYPRPPRDTKPGMFDGIQLGFLEEEEKVVDASASAAVVSSPSDIFDSFLEWGYMQHITDDGNVGSPACCAICPAQFFMPRAYSDVATGETKPVKKAGMMSSMMGTAEPTCCKTCPSRMMESSMLGIQEKDPDEPHQRPSQELATHQKNQEMSSVPRNPSNRREYGTEKAGSIL